MASHVHFPFYSLYYLLTRTCKINLGQITLKILSAKWLTHPPLVKFFLHYYSRYESVDAYFTKLNCIWKELRVYKPFPSYSYGNCNSECFQKYTKVLQKDYVFKFLNSPNEYQGLRSQLIAMKPFPSLGQVYNMVLREETQRSLYLRT